MKHSSKSKILLISLVVILTALIAARIAAPSIVTWYVNKTIERTPGIAGGIDDVDLALFRGAYRIEGVNLYQVGDGKQQPLLEVEEVDLSILWSALLRGELVSEIDMLRPTLAFYDKPEDDIIESEKVIDERTWIGLATDLVPFSIDRFTINQGTFLIEAERKLKRSSFTINDLQLKATNIANSADNAVIAKANLSGLIQQHAKLTIDARFNPNTKQPTFDINTKMERLPVKEVDSLIKFYAPFDFEAGEIDLAAELKAQSGELEGYIKFGIYDLDVFSWREDIEKDEDGPFTLLVEAVGGMLAWLFENDKRDLIATKVPISGKFDRPDISALEAFWGILRNAFVEAYKLDIEHTIEGLSGDSKEAEAKQPDS